MTNAPHRLIRTSVACLTLAALLAVSAEDAVIAMDDTAKPANLEEFRKRRKEAAHRKRRIMYNNDGGDCIAFCKEGTRDALLAARTTLLVDSQVDTVLYCTTASFGHFWHNTKVGQVFTFKGGYWPNNVTQALLDQGTDALEIVVNFCKQKKIEVFWTMRMNDTHDGYGYTDLLPKLKKDHPDWVMGTPDKPPKHGRWSAVDFGRPEIRDLAFRYIEEVCNNYDVDGVEMDFWRMPCFFRPHATGSDCTQKELDMMTGLVRRVREMTEQVGLKRGRPILVAVRVPDSVGYCRAIGLDVVRWMQDDLIDLLVVSGYFRLNPWEVSVELGHKYDVPVYPCLSNTWLKGEALKIRNSLENYRARATNVWDSGADGVYVFNVFPDDCAQLPPEWCHQLGDLDVLRTLDKVYLTGTRGVNSLYSNINERLSNGVRFLNRRPVNPDYPLPLPPGKTASCEVRVGEDVRKHEDRGVVPEVQLRLRIPQLDAAENLSVKLNGQPLGGGVKSDAWLELPVSPDLVKRGTNRFELTLKPGSSAEHRLEDLLLWVRYKKVADSGGP